MVSFAQERERIGGKKYPPLRYTRTHACGREGEKGGEKSPSPLSHTPKCSHAGEEGRPGSRGERRARRSILRDAHCFHRMREAGKRRMKRREKGMRKKKMRKERRREGVKLSSRRKFPSQEREGGSEWRRKILSREREIIPGRDKERERETEINSKAERKRTRERERDFHNLISKIP